MTQNKNVLIIGAGIGGIGAAHYIKTNLKNVDFTILESRENIGGTWDLFNYPGIRSDSEMFTFGFKDRPWTHPQSVSPKEFILEYLHKTVDEEDIGRHIQFSQHVTKMDWNSETNKWTTTATNKKDGTLSTFESDIVHICMGYYDYDQGYTPDFAGIENYKGEVIHPQAWSKDYDYSDKKVIIIGSGATAVTMAPAMTDKAKHITVLQRSPTYMIGAPDGGGIAWLAFKLLPEKKAHLFLRWFFIKLARINFTLCQKFPNVMKRLLIKGVVSKLNDKEAAKVNFTPNYNPWTQRLCFVSNDDLFNGINDGMIEMVTDHIDTFTENGIKTKSGKELDADLVVPATGLEMHFMKGVELSIDGKPKSLYDSVLYKGMMLEGVPNFLLTFGYFNSSWTLKVDLLGDYFVNLMKHMQKNNLTTFKPEANKEFDRFMDLDGLGYTANYMKRGWDRMPRMGMERPWLNDQNYTQDIKDYMKDMLDEHLKLS